MYCWRTIEEIKMYICVYRSLGGGGEAQTNVSASRASDEFVSIMGNISKAAKKKKACDQIVIRLLTWKLSNHFGGAGGCERVCIVREGRGV